MPWHRALTGAPAASPHHVIVYTHSCTQVVEEAVNPLHAFRIPPEDRSKNPGEVTAATRWLLDHVPVLAGFTPRLLRNIASAVASRSFGAGDVIRPEGGDTNFYIVVKGRVLIGAYASSEWDGRRHASLAYPAQPSLDASTSVLSDPSITVLAEPFALSQGATFGVLGIISVRHGQHSCVARCAPPALAQPARTAFAGCDTIHFVVCRSVLRSRGFSMSLRLRWSRRRCWSCRRRIAPLCSSQPTFSSNNWRPT